MISTHTSCDHNAYHRRFRDTWSQRAKEVTRPFTFQAKAAEMAKNQHKSELLIRSHPRGRGFESLQVHQNKRPSERMVFYFVMDRGGRGLYPERADLPSLQYARRLQRPAHIDHIDHGVVVIRRTFRKAVPPVQGDRRLHRYQRVKHHLPVSRPLRVGDDRLDKGVAQMPSPRLRADVQPLHLAGRGQGRPCTP